MLKFNSTDSFHLTFLLIGIGELHFLRLSRVNNCDILLDAPTVESFVITLSSRQGRASETESNPTSFSHHRDSTIVESIKHRFYFSCLFALNLKGPAR